MYQESERLDRKDAFVGTLSNFATRLLLCLSFVLIVLLFQTQAIATVVGIVWGMTLLCGLTYVLARNRGVSAMSEIGKHLTVALLVVIVSKSIGHWITARLVG